MIQIPVPYVTVSHDDGAVLIHLTVCDGEHASSVDMMPDRARSIAQRLIDAAARADGIEMPPLCQCAAGERTAYEICRECNDGDRYEEAHRP